MFGRDILVNPTGSPRPRWVRCGGETTGGVMGSAPGRAAPVGGVGRSGGVVGLALLAVPPAVAAAPANDARTAPQRLTLPTTVQGTTVEATVEPDEPSSACGRAIKGSVWYEFTATSSRSVLLAVDAAGDMDAALDVFRRQRSQLTSVVCRLTNDRGEATVDIDVAEDATYLVRVAPLSNSVADRFSLLAVVPDRPADPPGPQLPAGGVTPHRRPVRQPGRRVVRRSSRAGPTG